MSSSYGLLDADGSQVCGKQGYDSSGAMVACFLPPGHEGDHSPIKSGRASWPGLNARANHAAMASLSSEPDVSNDIPMLWSHEEDTYTELGHETIDSLKAAIRKITDPLVDAGVDAAHLAAITTEAAQSAAYGSWNRRQDHPYV